MALLLLAVIALGFVVYLYGLSGVQEARSQALLYQRLQTELAEIGGFDAPLGPTAAGSPIAILDIPSIGIHDMVVVEGTSPENLTLGPGHRRDTPYPGQAGVSQIFGRRATFGAPFARLAELRPGDFIETITGQGEVHLHGRGRRQQQGAHRGPGAEPAPAVHRLLAGRAELLR